MATSFYDRVLAVRPKQDVKPSTFWVAVLKSDIKPSDNFKELDFLWIKCHGGITAKVICAQYSNKYPQEGKITLKYGPKVLPDGSTMRQLDERGERMVPLEAIKISDLPSRMIAERLPLTPTTAQLSAKASSDDLPEKVKSEDALRESPGSTLSKAQPYAQDENVKAEAVYQTPYSPPHRPAAAVAVTTPPRPSVAPHHPPGDWSEDQSQTPDFCDPSPQAPQTFSTSNLPDWATSNGFVLYAMECRPKFQARHPGLNDGKLT